MNEKLQQALEALRAIQSWDHEFYNEKLPQELRQLVDRAIEEAERP